MNNEKEFRVGLDVRQFKPEEINIKTRDNRVVVHGKHEERPDEHGFIMREFTRQYVLPKVNVLIALCGQLNSVKFTLVHKQQKFC